MRHDPAKTQHHGFDAAFDDAVTAATTSKEEQTRPTMAEVDLPTEGMMEEPLKEVNVESLFQLSRSVIDLEKIDSRRRSITKSAAGDGEQDSGGENDWNKHLSKTFSIDQEEPAGSLKSALSKLPEKEQELLKVAACLGSFDMRLLDASTALSEEELSLCLETAIKEDIIKEDENCQYVFASDDAEKEAYGLIPQQERRRLHLTIGRNLVRILSSVEIEHHAYEVLLQFHSGMKAITSQTERNAIAVLCLRATHGAVAFSDFRAACNYSEFGVILLGSDCWKDEYDLSLALYNASAEVSHCVANYERVDEVVSAVLENARCFQDTLRVRAARVHSLSSSYRMTEALEEGLDILKLLGEKFPSKPRKYHALLAFVRTKRLFRGKTNEMILRMPLMENPDKIAAMQMLNLIFPNAFHVDPILFVLLALRLVRLTGLYGLSTVSSVGFAAYSSMLANFHTDKTEGYRYSELALALIGKFEGKQYIPRAYFFLYSETMAHKFDLRTLCTHLYRAYQVGLETGDIEVSSLSCDIVLLV